MDLFFWICWFVNASFAYFWMRRKTRKDSGTWTQIDRLFWVICCVAGGTFITATIFMVEIASAICRLKWAKKEARW